MALSRSARILGRKYYAGARSPSGPTSYSPAEHHFIEIGGASPVCEHLEMRVETRQASHFVDHDGAPAGGPNGVSKETAAPLQRHWDDGKIVET